MGRGCTLCSSMPDVAQQSPTPWLFVHEAALVLRVSEWTVRRWVRSGRLRSVRPGRRRLVSREDVERLIALPAAAHREESGSGLP